MARRLPLPGRSHRCGLGAIRFEVGNTLERLGRPPLPGQSVPLRGRDSSLLGGSIRFGVADVRCEVGDAPIPQRAVCFE